MRPQKKDAGGDDQLVFCFIWPNPATKFYKQSPTDFTVHYKNAVSH